MLTKKFAFSRRPQRLFFSFFPVVTASSSFGAGLTAQFEQYELSPRSDVTPLPDVEVVAARGEWLAASKQRRILPRGGSTTS
jgi:hypothetical protein